MLAAHISKLRNDGDLKFL
ncbi:unnamed protein product, partial [Rotaria magnacalcarata]